MKFRSYSVQEVYETVMETGRTAEPSMALSILKDLYGANMRSGKVTDCGFVVEIIIDPYETINPTYFHFDSVFNA